MDEATYNRRLDEILSAMDLDRLRDLMAEVGNPPMTNRLVLEAAAHKTRVERTSVASALRLESIEWLKVRSLSRWKGLPWPPEGQLPE